MVEAPVDPGWQTLGERFFRSVPALTFGIVSARRRTLWLGPLRLIEFGAPEAVEGGWRWPVAGGLLARRPGGYLELTWRYGRLAALVEDYAPGLPWPVYAAVQRPVHHLLMRATLLRLRGRSPAPGMPAEPARRVLAAGIDLAVCAGVAGVLARRRRSLVFAAVAVAYHVGCWAHGGQTLGGRITGQRVVGVDGSPVTLGQALVRLAFLPWAAWHLRALHDEGAGTEVVLTGPGGSFPSTPGRPAAGVPPPLRRDRRSARPAAGPAPPAAAPAPGRRSPPPDPARRRERRRS